MHAHSSSSTPAVQRPSAEVAYEVEYVECDGRWWALRTGRGWARSCGGLRGLSVGSGGDGCGGDHAAPVPASPSCSCFSRCLRFSSITECSTFQLYAEMGTHSAKLCRTPSRPHRCRIWFTVVDVSVNRSDQLQQFTFVVGVPVQIPAEFSQAQVVGTLLAQRLVRQWIHALRQFLGAFGRASRIFYVKVETRILKSMLSCALRRGSRSVHSRCFSCIAEVVAHKNLDTTFMSPLFVTVICSPSGRFRRGVFEPSTSHSCELSRALGVAGSPVV